MSRIKIHGSFSFAFGRFHEISESQILLLRHFYKYGSEFHNCGQSSRANVSWWSNDVGKILAGSCLIRRLRDLSEHYRRFLNVFRLRLNHTKDLRRLLHYFGQTSILPFQAKSRKIQPEFQPSWRSFESELCRILPVKKSRDCVKGNCRLFVFLRTKYLSKNTEITNVPFETTNKEQLMLPTTCCWDRTEGHC